MNQQLLEQSLDPYRKAILLQFCLGEIAVSIQFLTCSPIPVALSKIYGIDSLLVGATATLQMFLFPIFTFPSTLFLKKNGVHNCVKFGAMVILLGSVLRCLTIFTKYLQKKIVSKFYWIIIGSFVIGCGRPFLINMQGDVTSIWFPKEARTKIMSLLNFIVTIMLTGGVVISSLGFTNYDDKNVEQSNLDIGRRRFNYIIAGEAIFSALVFVPMLFLFRKKENQQSPGQEDFLVQCKALFLNLRYILVLVPFTLCFGTFKGISVSLPFMTNYYDYKAQDMAPLAIAPILGGMMSSALVSKAYKKTGRFKPWVVGIELITVGLFFVLFVCLRSQKLWLMFILNIILGFTIMPSVPLMIEWGCKVAAPISDSFAIGILYSGATLGGALFGEIQIKILDGENADERSIFITLSFMAGLYALACVLSLINNETRRTPTLMVDDKDCISPILGHHGGKISQISAKSQSHRFYTISNSIDVNNCVLVGDDQEVNGIDKYLAYDLQRESSIIQRQDTDDPKVDTPV